MKRQNLTDDTGRWFDFDSVIDFDENSDWDGNNFISAATGSQWDHEKLYYTRSGRWILNEWSQWQGTTETYEEIGQETATQWLAENERYDEIGKLPKGIREAVETAFDAAEI